VIIAPEITPPFLSETVPLMPPRLVCAMAAAAQTMMPMIMDNPVSNRIVLFI
jgi:hypothetical protein